MVRRDQAIQAWRQAGERQRIERHCQQSPRSTTGEANRVARLRYGPCLLQDLRCQQLSTTNRSGDSSMDSTGFSHPRQKRIACGCCSIFTLESATSMLLTHRRLKSLSRAATCGRKETPSFTRPTFWRRVIFAFGISGGWSTRSEARGHFLRNLRLRQQFVISTKRISLQNRVVALFMQWRVHRFSESLTRQHCLMGSAA